MIDRPGSSEHPDECDAAALAAKLRATWSLAGPDDGDDDEFQNADGLVEHTDERIRQGISEMLAKDPELRELLILRALSRRAAQENDDG